MKEIGGYIELEKNYLPMLHDGAKALNSGTACLAYLIRAKKIKKLALPLFLCDCIRDICLIEGVDIREYKIKHDFLPDYNFELISGEWIYIVNFFGQLTEEDIFELVQKYKNVIFDQAQAYFDKPINGVDTLYTCRKFFGVPDGAFLYTEARIEEELPKDESFERMHFLLGRYERTAEEFYSEYNANNFFLKKEPIKTMSKLTDNLLHGIDYNRVKNIRTCNYGYLYEYFREINQLHLRKIQGAFAYPLLLPNGASIRKQLLKSKVYIPTLWPNVLYEVEKDSLEYNYANNILPLPVDQRYDLEDMQMIIDMISEYIKEVN